MYTHGRSDLGRLTDDLYFTELLAIMPKSITEKKKAYRYIPRDKEREIGKHKDIGIDFNSHKHER